MGIIELLKKKKKINSSEGGRGDRGEGGKRQLLFNAVAILLRQSQSSFLQGPLGFQIDVAELYKSFWESTQWSSKFLSLNYPHDLSRSRTHSTV